MGVGKCVLRSLPWLTLRAADHEAGLALETEAAGAAAEINLEGARDHVLSREPQEVRPELREGGRGSRHLGQVCRELGPRYKPRRIASGLMGNVNGLRSAFPKVGNTTPMVGGGTLEKIQGAL